YSESEANKPHTYSGLLLNHADFGWRIDIKQRNDIASMKRIEFIKAILIKNTSSDIWCLISITCKKAELQKSKRSLKKSEILSIINSLTSSLGDLDQLHFCGLSNNFCENLINILQKIRNILTKNSINISEV
ncbi:798_t:CDS:2, partial [Dentiscutata heterogama]